MAVTSLSSLRLATEIIRCELNPDAIILFGSQATGNATLDSDTDILVVDGESFGPERQRRLVLARLRNALGAITSPMDVLLYSRKEYNYWKDAPNHIIARALREGKILYERPENSTAIDA